jgi:hypothetical protein
MAALALLCSAGSHADQTEERMIQCPCCSQVMLEDDERTAQLEDEIACSRCGHVWAVASVHPMTLAAVEEEQRHETD